MPASSTESKVLIIVGNATETVDTLYPYYRLQEDGFLPVVAEPQKNNGGYVGPWIEMLIRARETAGVARG